MAETPPAGSSGPVPQLLEGRWRIFEKIGAGGMGAVHRGEELASGKPVAIKLLAANLCRQPQYVERFEREARLMASVRHPNVIALEALGRLGERPYMVMPLLKGKPLHQLISPWIAPPEALRLFEQMCRGVDALHRAGVVHRDLKPANLFVSEDGHLTVLDLGIARTVDTKLTRTGVIFGTPSYLSPEQVVGDKNIDARSDVYSLAVVLFEMLAGQLPFQGEGHQVMLAHLTQAPPDLTAVVPELPPSIKAVMDRALAKLPDQRIASALELHAEVEACLAAAPPAAPEPAVPPAPPPRGTSRPGLPRREAGATVISAVPPAPQPGWPWRRVVAIALGVAALFTAALVVDGLEDRADRRAPTPLATPGVEYVPPPPPPPPAPELATAEQRRAAFYEEKPVDTAPPVKEWRLPPEVTLRTGAAGRSMPGLGTLLIETTAYGRQVAARIALNGKPVGASPAILNVKPGEHRLRVEQPGYVPVDFKLPITAGVNRKLEVALLALGSPEHLALPEDRQRDALSAPMAAPGR